MRIGWTRAGMLAASIVGILVLTAAPVAGHETLVASDPDAGAVLSSAPDAVSLTFSGELEADGSGFLAYGPGGETVGTGSLDLEVAERNVVRGSVAITSPGRYEVHWRVIGLDGHPITGVLAFTVGDAPNTALPLRGGPAAIGLGALLLAGGLMARRALVGARA